MILGITTDMNLRLIMCMMMKYLRSRFIKILQDYQYVLLYRVIMQQYLRMDKLEQAKPIQCRVLNIIWGMRIEE